MILCAYYNENHSLFLFCGLLNRLFEILRVSIGMAVGGNGNYISGINGNWTIV